MRAREKRALLFFDAFRFTTRTKDQMRFLILLDELFDHRCSRSQEAFKWGTI